MRAMIRTTRKEMDKDEFVQPQSVLPADAVCIRGRHDMPFGMVDQWTALQHPR